MDGTETIGYREDISESQEQLNIAKQHKWRLSGWQKQLNKHFKRLEFYAKIKAALEAGFYIVPPFPVDIFAIRMAQNWPDPKRTPYKYDHDQPAENLPLGEGRYVDTRPRVYEVSETKYEKDAAGHEIRREVTRYEASEFREVDFPFKLAKPEIMGATAKAMALKIFDRFGILPGMGRKIDPIICGQIIIPNQPSYSKNSPEIVNFFVAWWLSTSTLPK